MELGDGKPNCETAPVSGNGAVQGFTYDAASRLASLTNNLGGGATTHDVATSFTYNPASQIASVTRSNDAYAWAAHYNVTRTYAVNGLNQYLSAGPATFGYDPNGNLTSDGASTYVYDIENRLVSASGASSAQLRVACPGEGRGPLGPPLRNCPYNRTT